MPSLKTFRIEFDRPGATYSAGEAVTGNVILHVTKEKNVRELSLTAKGEASVHWSERKSTRNSQGKTETHDVHYRGSEHYFTIVCRILQNQGGDSRVTIPAGQHRYPFQFQLPYNIPCSFEHGIGYIRYTVKAVIDRPWKFDHECKAAFSVVSPLNLNSYGHQCLGVDDETEENFCCFCCINMGSMKVQIRLPSSGYVPGQSIDTTVNYSNTSSSVELTKITTKLERSLKFHSRTPAATKTETSEVTSTKVSGPFDKHGETVVHLTIPPIPPSHLEFCGIIELDYKLSVHAHVSGMHCQINKSYPILIGTIPLQMATAPPAIEQLRVSSPFVPAESTAMPMPVPMPMPMPMPMPLPSAPYPETSNPPTGGFPSAPQPPGFVIQPGPSSSTWDMPPPTYEECMSGTQNIQDHNESHYVHGASEPFTPRYAVFSYPAPSLTHK